MAAKQSAKILYDINVMTVSPDLWEYSLEPYLHPKKVKICITMSTEFDENILEWRQDFIVHKKWINFLIRLKMAENYCHTAKIWLTKSIFFQKNFLNLSDFFFIYKCEFRDKKWIWNTFLTEMMPNSFQFLLFNKSNKEINAHFLISAILASF